ncbi:Oidioi.mRNA.OKI2018_I69.XSR.g15649.t1.cds [Oikopleura dioica]|uniref:Oidioi.mRNA.OKI2018_I69.XSR.g15649.t1.cds n=1 Tax=Oikopleura dioica TaxID=34765 RepID=A0ABN7SMR0_OIKDI|nr:Oidioi.mRNA.OKI2018_I69.XSR.g15649.t1.cds [Oikopleura dioica]
MKNSFDFAGGRKIAPVTPTNQVTKMDESSSESSDEEPPRKPSREVRRTVLVSKSPTPPPPKEPTPSPKSPTPAPVEKTPPPPPIKSPTPPLIVESRAQTSQTRVITPVDFDSDPEPLPEPNEERPPVAPPAPPALSAFKPAPEVRESEVMGVPKSKDVPSISYIAAQAAEAANKRSLKKADGEIDTSTGNYGLDFARNEKKFGTVKRFKIPNHRKPKIDIFGEPAKPQPEHNPPQTVHQAQGMNQRGTQGKSYAYHSSGSQFQGMPLHSSNQQSVPPRSHNRAPSAQPSQMAPSVVGQAIPPQSYPQRGYYDDSTAHRRSVQQPIHQPAPIPEHPGHFRNHIPQYAQPPINEQMAPPPQNYYPAASYAPQDHTFTVPQQQYNRPYEYHQPAPLMHTANVLPSQTVGYAPSVVDQRSVSQAPPHQTNDKVIQYVIQLPRIHDQSVHAAGPAPQIIIK